MPSRMKTLDKRFSLTEAEGRFKKACDQIVLNKRLGEVQKRYKMAKTSQQPSLPVQPPLKAGCHRRCA
ncbi:hypothetical protein DPMN_078050 [Dreissena polymorpha]|uniref:Uncharacterized protein n=1 Tax=Dreissena polymorpha TaxID=45954 RepID=A0A9D4BRU9_DREPO|nr:hypothetical protein DPMN_078050 [Dreissena polymorpha]